MTEVQRRGLAFLIALVVAVTVHASQSDRPKGPPPGTLVDVGGYRLHLHCIGTGAPTVVFEAGSGDDSTRWTAVQGAVSKRVRACAYDRAGSGWSEEAPAPRTMKHEVAELHSLLAVAKVYHALAKWWASWMSPSPIFRSSPTFMTIRAIW